MEVPVQPRHWKSYMRRWKALELKSLQTQKTDVGLMPGTDYTLRMLASTRGGQGRWSPPVSFRTQGEARFIDMEAFVTTVPPTLPLPPLPPLLQPQDGDLDGTLEGDLEATVQPVYFVPDKVSGGKRRQTNIARASNSRAQTC
ncbi:hypothetical protein TSMEX_010141 [Taenia solium]|eukprot:TsM_001044300 transcript=TsM_001044300 gene=TsM_001044300